MAGVGSGCRLQKPGTLQVQLHGLGGVGVALYCRQLNAVAAGAIPQQLHSCCARTCTPLSPDPVHISNAAPRASTSSCAWLCGYAVQVAADRLAMCFCGLLSVAPCACAAALETGATNAVHLLPDCSFFASR
jgi:hypothetical protein